VCFCFCREFDLGSTEVNITGFDPYYTTAVNITSIPGYCTNNAAQCARCNAQYDVTTCTVDVVVDTCEENSPIYNSSLCASVGGKNTTADAAIPGPFLLEALGIVEMPREEVYNALWHQFAVYVLIFIVFGWVYFRDWSRKSLFTDVYHYMFPIVKDKKYR
jgi:hypothetical protein